MQQVLVERAAAAVAVAVRVLVEASVVLEEAAAQLSARLY